MQSFFAVVFVLGILIAFHELGHFLVAKLFGIGVKTFSLGFGPRLLAFTKGRTQYRLSAIPLGGYVQLVGEQPADDPEAEPEEGFSPKEYFNLRPAWQRMLVVVSGPVFNFVLAAVLYWGLFWAHGRMELLPVVGEVRADSPAAVAGILAKDKVVAIDGAEILYWREMAATIGQSQGKVLRFSVMREGKTLDIPVTPKISERKNLFGESINTPLIGVTSAGETVTIPLDGASAFVEGMDQTWDVIKLTGEGFVKLVARVIPFDTVGGPILIAQMVSKQAEQGFSNLLALTAVISVNLGLINLLPIPVLDGGHILFFGIETIFRRPVNRSVQAVTTKIGLVFLITLMLFALYNDLHRIFKSWL